MEIIDLSEEHNQTYFLCLEDWSDEMKESGDHKARWYERMKTQRLCVKLAVDDKGTVAGMIQYLPIEHSFVEGNDLYFIMCIWVHGYKEGIGNFQKQGMGTALLNAAEEDVRERKAKGMVAWGLSLPFWMKASWFKKHGYSRVDKRGIQEMVWKPFSLDAKSPKWIHEKKKPEPTPGRVTVTSFINGWCPAQNIVHERAKRASDELGEMVEFRYFNTQEPEVFKEWGIVDGLFIDDKRVRTGPPPSYEKIHKKIARQVKKLK